MSKLIIAARLLLVVVLGGLSSAASAQTSDAPYPLATGSGYVEALDLAGSTLVVDGLTFGVTLDVDVEVDGSYAAFTMLQPGMRIYYEYLVISRTDRRMVTIRELPDTVELQET